MDDLIGRAEAQTAIQFAARRYMVAHEAHGGGQVVWSDNLINVIDAMNVLRDLPSIQPERKAGHWIHQAKFSRVECDQCGKVFRNTFTPKNFCPNCGADMRGEKDETD